MQTELTERDLGRIRLRFLDILKSFFQAPPDSETLSRWRGIFTALEGKSVTQSLDVAIHGIGEVLIARTLSQIQDEFYRLFVDPYSKDTLPLNATYYLDGKSFGPSLAELREIMKQGRVIKETDISEPEDALPVMLDTLMALITDEIQGNLDARALQNTLLQEFLIPTTKQIREQIQKRTDVIFYQQCTGFLSAYLELEQSLIEEEGLTANDSAAI